MIDIEWPEGATHKINDKFVKWVDVIEFNFERGAWQKPLVDWSLAKYMEEGFDVIERPKELELYKPEVGEWFIASGGAKMAFVGIDSGNAYVCEIDGGGLTRLCSFIGCSPIKSERDQFIEKFHGMDAGQMYDNGVRFTDE